MILAIRTDNPTAELHLLDEDQKLDSELWQAHRALAETIHKKLKDLLNRNGKSFSDIKSIVVYEGPGSFTGLRIGVAVANALAESLGVGIVGATGDNWLEKADNDLETKNNVVTPVYGSTPHITKQKR